MAIATLTTLTPVHVGSGETLQRGFDFVQKDGRIGFLDLDKIVDKIGINSIPQLTAQIENRKPLMDLPALRSLGIEDVSTTVVPAAGTSTTVQELKTHYRTALRGLCIPGSSIKGAIKTAIWETLMTDDVANSLQPNAFKNRRGKWNSDNIDKLLFGKDANTKSTRFLKVGDCAFGKEQAAEVKEVGIYNAFRNGWDFKNETLLAEVVPEKATAPFSIKLDTLLFERNIKAYPSFWSSSAIEFLKGSPAEFCQLINSYTLKQIQNEWYELEAAEFNLFEDGANMMDELTNVSEQAEKLQKQNAAAFVLRIGGHNGWNFTTGGWMKKGVIKETLSETDYSNLRRTIQRRDYGNMELWPKTRKMTMAGMPLGFVKIEMK